MNTKSTLRERRITIHMNAHGRSVACSERPDTCIYHRDREIKLHHQFIRQEKWLWKCRNNKSKRCKVSSTLVSIFFPRLHVDRFWSGGRQYLAVSPLRSLHTENPTRRPLIMAPITNVYMLLLSIIMTRTIGRRIRPKSYALAESDRCSSDGRRHGKRLRVDKQKSKNQNKNHNEEIIIMGRCCEGAQRTFCSCP